VRRLGALGLPALAVALSVLVPSTSQAAGLYVNGARGAESAEVQSHDRRLLGLRISVPASCQSEGGPVRKSSAGFALDPRRVVRLDRKGRFRIVVDRHYSDGSYDSEVVLGNLNRGFAKLRFRVHTYRAEEPGAWEAEDCWTGKTLEGDFVHLVARRRSPGAFYIQRNRNKRIWMWVKHGEIHHATFLLRETCLIGLGETTRRLRWASFPIPETMPIRKPHRRFGWRSYADHTYEIDSFKLGGLVRKGWIRGRLSHTEYVHASDENYLFHMECGTGRGYDSPEAAFAARRG
jgi:hypothetical protein